MENIFFFFFSLQTRFFLLFASLFAKRIFITTRIAIIKIARNNDYLLLDYTR